MAVTEDIVKTTVVIDGKQGINQLGALEMEANQLAKAMGVVRKEVADYEKKLARLDKLKPGGKAAEKLKQELEALKPAYDKNKVAIQGYESQLNKLNSEIEKHRKELGLSDMTYKQVLNLQRQLQSEIKGLTMGTDAYNKKVKELVAVNRVVDQHRAAIRPMPGIWSRMGAGIKSFAGPFLALFGTQELLNRLGQWSGKLLSLSDQLSNVEKTTGLTNKQVKELNAQIAGIDTRSSQEELLALASAAGKLGITGTKDIMEFVKAGDQINVALGEDLGDDAIKNIAKLNDVFGETKRLGVEQSLLATGSAINSLGQAGTANEAYLVDFTKRMAGVARQSKISIPNVLGLATTLDEVGQTSEVSSTSLTQLFIQMQKDSDTYAKVAGLNVQEFSRLLKEDANEAFIQFLEGLNNNSQGMQELAVNFENLGVDGTRAIGVISALAQNTDKLREKQALSNQEYSKASSITKEFETRNNNAAGAVEKIQKRLEAAFVNSAALAGLEKMVFWLEEITRTPVSETLERDRQAFMRLGAELLNTNEHSAERKKLITEMQALQPDFLKGLDTEKATNNEIAASLVKVNQQMLNRIILQRDQEKIDKRLEEAAEAQVKGAQMRLKFEEALLKIEGKYGISIDRNLTRQQQLTAVAQKFTQLQKEGRDVQAGDLGILSRLLIESNSSQKEGNDLQQEALTMQQERLKLAKELGIELDKQTEKTVTTDGKTDTNDPEKEALKKQIQALQEQLAALRAGSVDSEGNTDQELQALLDKYERFQQDLLAMKEGFALSQLDQDLQELEQINVKYEEQMNQLQNFYDKNIIADEEFKRQKRELDDMYRAEIEAKTAEFNERDLLARQEAQEQIRLFLLSDKEREMEEINAKYNALIELARQYGFDTVELERKRQEALNAVQQAGQEKSLENYFTYEQGRAEMIRGFAKLSSDTANFLATMSEEQGGFAKSMAIFTMLLKQAEAMSAAIAGALTAGGPGGPFAVVGYVASMIGTVLSSFAGVKRILDSAEQPRAPRFDAPSYFEGGPTTDKAIMPMGDRYGPFTGFTHANEYVLSEKMLENPLVLNAAMVGEAIRTGMGTGFANGGETSSNTLPSTAPPIQISGMMELLTETKSMHADMVRMMAQQKKIVFTWKHLYDIKEGLDDISDIETEAKL